MKKLLLLQPGRSGDIIICAPIAAHYSSRGFEIHWPVYDEYQALMKHFPYVAQTRLTSGPYDVIIDLSFGFGGKPELWWKKNMKRFDSFVTAKYELAKVPLEERWNLAYARDSNREDSLFNLVVPKGREFALVHDRTHTGQLFEYEGDLEPVFFHHIKEFSIFDWWLVIMAAKEIHCIDSSLANFIETMKEISPRKKFMYLSCRNPGQPWLNSLYKNNWEFK